MRKSTYILALIFIITLAARLLIAFQTPHFTGEESYDAIRQVESIRSTGLPLFHDGLSYGGSERIFTPFFYYFLALFNLLLPIGLVGKIIPNVLVASMVLLAYLISKDISRDDGASLFSAFIAGFIPVFFMETVNTISPYSLIFPLLMLSIYFFLRIEKEDYVYYFLASLLILTLTSPSVLILILGFLVYLFLLSMESLKQKRIEVEVIIFSLVIVTWIIFMIFKDAFLAHGISVIWKNMPLSILESHFSGTTILSAIYHIGPLPLSYGVYSVYDHLFRKKDRKIYLLVALAFSAAILLWARLIEVEVGLMCLGVIATLLFSKFYSFTFGYIKKTKFARLKGVYFAALLLAFMAASVLPSVMSGVSSADNAVSEDEFSALKWLNENSENGSVVASPVREGAMVAAISGRKNIADTNFLLKRDIDSRMDAIEKIYTAKLETDALDALTMYGVDYIYVSEHAREKFDINNISYASDERCFRLRYDSRTRIYDVLCELK